MNYAIDKSDWSCVSDFAMYMKNVQGRSERTIEAYLHDIKEFIQIVGEDTQIKSVSHSIVERQYINRLVMNGNSPASRSRKLSALKMFFKWCKSNGLIVENPVENVEMPKIPHKEPKVMSSDEVFDVVLHTQSDVSRESACEGFRNLAIIMLMFSTGIRRAEVTEIKLCDVDLQNASLLVHGKGSKERIVYYNDTTRAVLSEYIQAHRKLLKTAEHSDYLFVSKRDEKLNVSTINRIVNKYFEAAGIKDKGYTAHSTRKAFATQVYENTHDIFVVQNLLGHSSPDVTKRYVGMNEQTKKQAAQTVVF